MAHFRLSRRALVASTAALAGATALPARAAAPDAAAIRRTMRTAAQYMVDHVSHEGGYLWQVLPDRSREWGEMEAYPTSVWIQNPGTPLVGQLYLDAYHATGDDYFYQAACKAADVLIRGQLDSGGWSYMFDLAGEASIRKWYDTIGRNGWRLEEFQHYYGNGTFDDSCTSDVAKFMLRIYLEKREAKYKASLDKVIKFILDSQYPVGGWPQRYPLKDEFHDHGLPDYTSFITFNDDVSAENIEFLLMVWQTLGDERVLDPIHRGMACFAKAQQPQPQPAWGLQHTVADLKPAGARTYEPPAFVSHTTAINCALMMDFYELTGDTIFMKRLPEAFAWLDRIRLPASMKAPRPYPTFVGIGTNAPMFVHRRGSDVVNGEYYHDDNPANTIAHYSSFRDFNLDGLKARYAALMAKAPEAVTKGSPLTGGRRGLPRYFCLHDIDYNDLKTGADDKVTAADPAMVATIVASLDASGAWLTRLRTTSHRYTRDGYATPAPGDFSHTYVGDDTDTSPYPDPDPVMGISTQVFVRNMSVLVRHLAAQA